VPVAPVHAPVEMPPFREAFARIRAEFAVPAAFAPDVDAEAHAVARRGPVAPPGVPTVERVDARHLPLVTLDPLGSKDLDQAFHAERRSGGSGFRVHYAIADVASFVTPHAALDRESVARGVTLYLPDGRAPMLPNVLGEDAASLVPAADRPALLWTIELDDTGASTSARIERATVRSRAALDYASVQASLDAGRAEEPLTLLRDIGTLRRTLEAARGGVSLDLPSQEAVPQPAGGFSLRYAAPLPVEGWNAQISLLAGIEAAKIMLDARVGILRTLPSPEASRIDRLRRTARALDIAFPPDASWTDVVRSLDRHNARHAAFLVQAAHVLRGAGYAVLDASNMSDPDAVPRHSGIAAPYAHVTAPLRRLADRYANEIVLAHCAGYEPPEWAPAALAELVTAMQAADQRDAAIDRAVIDAVECALLITRVGERFEGVVIDENRHGVAVQLLEPAVVAAMPAPAQLGARIEVTVAAVDVAARRVELARWDR
jgi:exoribonuclease R